MYAYGPVPSRRLGNSIGVSAIPTKVCSYSCVYCQLGRTTKLQASRQTFFPKEEIFRDISKVMEQEKGDVITFAGDGEPTLCQDLGWLIRKSKQEFNIPLAVITNGSLLSDESVKTDLMAADIVLPTLDAGNADIFYKINRPHKTVQFDKMVQGLIDFNAEFEGDLWLEVMLVKDVNDSNKQLNQIQKIVSQIAPKKVFVMTPIRPPAEPWVQCSDSNIIHKAKTKFANAICFPEQEEGSFGISEFSSATEAIMEISGRHPLRVSQAREIERQFNEAGIIDTLLSQHIIQIYRYRRTDYIQLVRQRNKFKPKPAANIQVQRTGCCTYSVQLKFNDSEKQFTVVVSDVAYNSLSKGRMTQEELLNVCFAYFAEVNKLDRLKDKFTLRECINQWPDFEKGIHKKILD